MKRCLFFVVVSVWTASCTLGPNYRRPTIGMPSAYRDTTVAVAQPGPASVADVQWFDLFKDDTLGQLVRTALAQNFDLQIAAERVLQARERFHIVRADRFPVVVGSAGASHTRVSEIGARPLPPGFGPDVSDVQAGFGVAWELDVWGRLRRLNEAARAQYLATEEARRGVVITLIADVTDAYFALQTLDRQLAIAGATRDVAVNGLRLTELRRDRGVATRLDVRQALSLLLGQAPGDVARGGAAVQTLDAAPPVPPGLPSSLLERRPDIRQAEQVLVAANAQIGVAKADYFPRIGLTGVLGVA
jgi:outer membrane protein, multidrug efflux system